MKREIKFRVWDNVNYMSSSFSLEALISKRVQFTSDCQVMQYTCFKDQNGVQICEGDIVEDWVINTLCQIIFTDYGNWGLKPIGFKCKDLEYETIDPAYTECNLKVVGNIYETPELLTKKSA